MAWGMYCCFCHLLPLVERILPSHTASLERNGVRSGSDDLVTLFRSLERALHQYPLVCRIFAYNMCIKLLRSMCPPFYPKEAVRWALAVVGSRAFPDGSVVMLCPLLDLLNHHPPCQLGGARVTEWVKLREETCPNPKHVFIILFKFQSIT